MWRDVKNKSETRTGAENTALSQTEQQLLQAQEFWHSVVDNMSEIIMTVNRDGIILSINHTVPGMTPEQAIGKSIYDYIKASHHEIMRDSVNQVFQTGVDQRIEIIGSGPYGATSWYESRITPIKIKERIAAVSIVTTDIKERRKTEEALRGSETKYRTLLENLPQRIFLKDTNSVYVSCNDNFAKDLKIRAEELTGKTDYDFFPEELANKYRADDKSILESGQSKDIEERYVRGEQKGIIHTVKTPVKDKQGKITGILGIFWDITEQKKTQEEIKKFKTISDEAGYGTAIADINGNIIYVNESFAEMHGYKSGQLIGENLSIFHNEEQMRNVIRLNEQLIQQGSYIAEEVWHKKRDGTVFPTLMNGTLIRDEKGKLLFMAATAVDITKNKKTEDALRDSENKYRTLLENLPQRIFLKDTNSVYVSCNENFAKELKIKAEEFTGKTDYDFFPKELADKYRTDDESIIKSGQTKDIEERYVREGQERIVHTVKTPVRDERGKTIGILGIFWDITEHKKREEQLKESEQRLRTIFENAADGIVLADVQTMKFTTCNKMFSQMLGYEPDEIKNLGVEDVHPEQDLPNVIEQFEKQVRREITLAYNIPVKRKDSSIFYADINSFPITLRGKTYLMGIFRDITERKAAEEQIRKLTSAVEQSIDGIAILDLEPRLLYVNKAYAQMHGYTTEEIIGMHITKLHKPGQMNEYERDLNQIRTKGSWEGEVQRVRKNGSVFPAYISVTVLKDSDGEPTGILAVTRDITEARQREKELDIYREKMVRAEQLASLGTLSATLAHELTQPLTTIRLAIENSLAELQNTSCPDTTLEGLSDGLADVSNATSIVERFRNFARQSSERNVAEVDLKVVSERIIKLLTESAQRAQLSMYLKGIEELPNIYCNEKDLEQLFFALVQNAIHAADGEEENQLVISGVKKDEQVELSFSDDCCGIAPENIDKIFDPFFTTKAANKGTGLGLSIVQHIISQAGGKVRVESKLGEGTKFFVTFPINRNQGF